MSAPERLAATTDAESAAAAVVQAAAAQSKKLGAKAARAWRQLPDGGWQRRQAGDAPDPPRSRCAARPRRLLSLDSHRLLPEDAKPAPAPARDHPTMWPARAAWQRASAHGLPRRPPAVQAELGLRHGPAGAWHVMGQHAGAPCRASHARCMQARERRAGH